MLRILCILCILKFTYAVCTHKMNFSERDKNSLP